MEKTINDVELKKAIKKVLMEKGGLTAIMIKRELNSRGILVSYSRLVRNLNEMVRSGEIKREIVKSSINYKI